MKRVLLTLLFLVLPVLLVVWQVCFADTTSWYLVAAVLLLLSALPFFLHLERKPISAREMALLSVLTALAVVSRAVFYLIPQVKPIAAVVIAAVAAGCMARASKKANAYLGGSYLVAQATRQDLTLSVTGTATLKPADSYNVTTLISGEIENAPFELGDLVNKGDLLFALNSSDAQNNVDRAEISVAQAKMAYQQAKEALNPVASISGTIQELYVHNGDSVNAGAQIAKITSSMDLSIDFLFPYASPTDFYAGQAATVYIGNYDAPVSGTVDSVSNSTSITSNGLSAVSVRVKLANPGAVSDSFTASARIGNYASYGQTPINLGGATIVYAGASGTIQGLNKLAGSTVKQGEVLCTVSSGGAPVHCGVRRCPEPGGERPAESAECGTGGLYGSGQSG